MTSYKKKYKKYKKYKKKYKEYKEKYNKEKELNKKLSSELSVLNFTYKSETDQLIESFEDLSLTFSKKEDEYLDEIFILKKDIIELEDIISILRYNINTHKRH